MCSLWTEVFAWGGMGVSGLGALVVLLFATGILRTEKIDVSRKDE